MTPRVKGLPGFPISRSPPCAFCYVRTDAVGSGHELAAHADLLKMLPVCNNSPNQVCKPFCPLKHAQIFITSKSHRNSLYK